MVGVAFGDGKPGALTGGLPSGGNPGDVLYKRSANPFDAVWQPQLTPIFMTSGTADMNDYKTAGIYYFSGSTLSNVPNGATSGWLVVLVNHTGTSIKQIWNRLGTNPTSFLDTYVRLYTSGAWGAWAALNSRYYGSHSVRGVGVGISSSEIAFQVPWENPTGVTPGAPTSLSGSVTGIGTMTVSNDTSRTNKDSIGFLLTKSGTTITIGRAYYCLVSFTLS